MWVEGAVEIHPMTSTGCKIQWQVFIETRHGAELWADFLASDNARIDASYVTDKLPVTLAPSGKDNTSTVDLDNMVQNNQKTGTDRRIRRDRCPEAHHGLSEATPDVPWALRTLQQRRSRPLPSIKQRVRVVRMRNARQSLASLSL